MTDPCTVEFMREGDNRKDVPAGRSIFSGLYLVEKDCFGKFGNFLFLKRDGNTGKHVIRYKTEFASSLPLGH